MSAVKDPDQVAALVRCFLDSEVAKKQKKLTESFEKIAEANLPWSKPQTSDLSDTKEERLEHASKIQAKIAKNKAYATKKGKFRLTAVHVATIFILPIDDLRKGGWLSHEAHPETLLHMRLQLMSNLVKHYLTKAQEALTIADRPPETDQSTADESATQSMKRSHPERELRSRKRNSSATSPYLEEETSESEAGPSQASKPTKADNDPDYKPKPHVRSEAEKKKCRERDLWRCLFQRTGSGQVCHILPFTWNNTEQAVQDTKAIQDAFVPFFDDSTRLKLADLLMDVTTLGETDKVWNMLYLNPQLRSYWGQARIGLFCKAIGPYEPDKSRVQTDVEDDWVDVIIQFNWLNRREGKPNDEMADKDAMNAMAEMQIQHENEGSPSGQNKYGADIDAMRVDTRTSVLSGHEVRIAMPPKDAALCKLMLDLQWAIIRIAAMSGAAGYPELLPVHRDWNKVKAIWSLYASLD
ncbi:uncharacterized protein FIESC28_03465 [Fusarium coffeatum]|uniref:HNH nuclease domain-containing protein n=1 Tax=Fusarium coffeatum TaxID=231269 RepID=A0A366S2X6_9HYPO|nr:uncharacterized protein FIESC28_03465 [Fusarium coffeatum]RBR23669.1 hypothetical protein FIESC28_03465 [Fusarium coffeatum]